MTKHKNFEIGKAVQIGEGTDASIIATGDVVCEAIKAKEELEKTRNKCKSNRHAYNKTNR